MTQHSSAITLDHILAWSSRRKLIEADLREASQETRIRWANLMRLLVTQRAQKHGVRDEASELAPDLILSEAEKAGVVDSLSHRFARKWRIHRATVWRAVRRLSKKHGNAAQAIKQRTLQPAIVEALHDADHKKVVRVGSDRVWTLGSRLLLLQKQDLERSARHGNDIELIRKLSAQPAGLRGSPSGGAHESLNPIEAAFRLAELEDKEVRPLDLRPALLLRWMRVRATKLAEERLLQEAGLDSSDAPDSFREVEVRNRVSETDHDRGSREAIDQFELLETLNEEEPRPLEELIAVEQREYIERIATQRQLEYFEAVCKKMAQGLDKDKALETVAEEKGVKPNTVHKNFQRIRDRVGESLTED